MFGAGSWWAGGHAAVAGGLAGGLAAASLPVGRWAGGRVVGRWASVQEAAAWGLWPACSFCVLWHGEDFHRLGVQGAKVSALPGALPQPSVSPESQQDP
jgi:hypothetical protein